MKKTSGLAGFHVFVGGLDIGELLAFVAPHEEHAGAYAVLLELRHGVADLRDGDAALHGVEMRCEPLSEPIHTRSQPSSASCAATRAFSRSARVMHSKGTRRPRRLISAAYSSSQPWWIVNTSSANHSCSGW